MFSPTTPNDELGNWSGPPDQGQSEDEDDYDFISFSSSDAEYFATANLNSLEDVSAAIDACKKSILETTENTSSRKAMVNRLIQLQIRQEDLKEKSQVSSAAASDLNIETRGHRFIPYSLEAKIPGVTNIKKGVYCQQCGTAIWVALQSAQFCSGCGFGVHTSCMENIMRTCVALKAKTQPDFIMDICPERMLPQLKYRCVECDKKFSNSRPPRLCDYTGLSFCPDCHWNATSATPARIVHNWDFEPRSVSQATKQYLYLMHRKPVIDIAEANPKLFAIVQELVEVAEHRANLMLMKKYLTLCRIALEEKLLLHLISRQHFVDGPHLYSLQDLADVKSGSLLTFLTRVTGIFAEHIRGCVLCNAKGFICEICKEGEILFPFDKEAAVCPGCEGAFHRQCYRQQEDCPRCARLRAKKALKKANKQNSDASAKDDSEDESD
jgi:hypothetical protein